MLILLQVAASSSAAAASAAEEPEAAPRVRKIEWKGLENIAEKDLEEAILTTEKSWKPWVDAPPFDAGTFEQDLTRIGRFLRRRGYYEARVESRIIPQEDHEVIVEVTVEEGRQVPLEDFRVELKKSGAEASPLSEAELGRELALVPGTGFTAADYEDAKTVLLERLARRGYPAAAISGGAEVDLERYAVLVNWQVDPGSFVRMKAPTLEGVERAAPELALGEVEWSTGAPYDPRVLRRTQRAIFDLGLFRSVTVEAVRSEAEPGATEAEQVWPIRIRVRERAPRAVRASVGYGTEDQVRARLEWKHRNFLGGLRNLRIGAKYSFLVRGVDVVFVQPRFITRPTKLTLSGAFNEDTQPAFDTRGFTAGWQIERPLFGEWRGRIGQRFEFKDVTNVAAETDAAIVEDDENQSFRLIYFLLGARHSTLDSELDPTRGTWFDLSLEPSWNELGSDVSYLKSVVELRHFISVSPGWVIASRVRLGTLEPVGGDDAADVPVFKRFFSGGSTTVRGFDLDQLGPLSDDNDPLGGLTLAEASIELRFPIWRDLGGVAFADAGQVALDSFELRGDDFFYSAGAGLRYSTPIGPLRLDFARILNAPKGPADFRVHFSIGHAF